MKRSEFFCKFVSYAVSFIVQLVLDQYLPQSSLLEKALASGICFTVGDLMYNVARRVPK